MSRRLATIVACLVMAVRTAGVAAAEPPVYQPVLLSAAQATSDVALLRRALQTIHPGLVRYTSPAEIDAAFTELEAVAAAPVTDVALWRATALLLARIHCGHTKTEAPASVVAWRQAHPTLLPLRFRVIEGRMLVQSSDGQPGAPPPGAEIVAINGHPVPLVLARIGHAVAFDGDARQAIASNLAADSDLTGDDLDEYWPAFYGFAPAWTLSWRRDGDLKMSTSTLAPIALADWAALPWPGAPWREEFHRSVRWQLDESTATLRIDTFVNYRNPVDAMAFLDAFFATLKARGVRHLILDLRANGGGSDDAAIALARHLLADGFVWEKPALLKAIRYGDLAAHIESWGDPAEIFDVPESRFRHLADGRWERLPRPGNPDDEAVTPQRASPLRFDGRLTILAGPANASGATMAIAQLRARPDTRVVGEDTAGSAEGPTAGRILTLALPASGLKVRIPVAWDRVMIDRFEARRGVAADDWVEPTADDALHGRDRALEFALQPPAAPAPALGALFEGRWTGTLDYRDFTSDRRVVLPTTAVATRRGAAGDLALVFDDGPGKTVRSAQSWQLLADGRLQIHDGDNDEQMSVVEFRAGTQPGEATLVARGHGLENGAAVDVRLVVARRGDRLSISRSTALPGELLLLRDVYLFQREH